MPDDDGVQIGFLSTLISVFRSSSGAFVDVVAEGKANWDSDEGATVALDSKPVAPAAALTEAIFFLSSLLRLELCPGCEPW